MQGQILQIPKDKSAQRTLKYQQLFLSSKYIPIAGFILYVANFFWTRVPLQGVGIRSPLIL